MDVVDLVLVALLVFAAVQGLRLGALVVVLTFAGFVVGLVLGLLLAVATVGSLHSSNVRTAVTIALVMGLAVLFGVAGRVAGSWSHAAVRRHHLGGLDAALGAGVAAVAVLLSAWMVANVLADSRYTTLSAAIDRSDILRSVDRALPPVPAVFARVQTFLAQQGFPTAFAGLPPPAAGPVVLPGSARARALAAPAVFSTVKVVGDACGYRQEGSGFVVGPGLVVTNAHVVAGESVIDVVDGTGTARATPVLYDPEFDLAVLRTGLHLGPSLPIDGALVGRGTQGAVLGYPEDGPLTVVGAGVAAELTAEGRDIYDNGLVVRAVYQLEAQVLPGNSGGPLMGPNGQVIGVVFSRSTTQGDVGYALASPHVASLVASARTRTAPVSTEGCTPS